MRTLRNIFRRKLRAILTISGIIIGVFALVVMGAMAEKMTLLVNGGTKYYSDKVSVSQGGYAASMIGGSIISKDVLTQIEKMPEVNIVSANVSTTLEKEMSAVSMGPPAMIVASDQKGTELDNKTFKMTYASGRAISNNEPGTAVVGSDLVKKLDAKLGGKIKIRDKEFTVVGIMEKTLSVPDTSVTVPLSDAQELIYNEMPDFMKGSVKKEDIITSIIVYPKDGVNPDDLAKKLTGNIKDISALGPKAFQDQVTNAVALFNSIIIGIALISLLVGGLSVMNTMTMSISERTREIGIRKSIGASRGKIIKQFLAESALMSLMGGSIGLGFGWLFAIAANAAGNASGTTLFLITPRLAIGSLLFALFLGVFSGFFPAWRASKLNPVEALRYE